METIYKYPLKIVHRQVIDMPISYQLLSAQFQGDQLCLWAEVNTDAPVEKTVILIFGTGHQLPDKLNVIYLSTVQDPAGLVWHVFEETAPRLRL